MKTICTITALLCAGALAVEAPAAPKLYPRPKPLASMTLTELAHWQAAAHHYYRGKVRAWIRRASPTPLPRLPQLADGILVITEPPAPVPVAPLPRCHAAGMRLPHGVCWYARAARWTARELTSTRRALAAQRRTTTTAPRVDACLDKLIRREGGYNPHAVNPTSGAYGAPQALPGSKMASAGADWRDNLTTQIRWMLHYLHERYGSTCAGLAHSYAFGWY